MRRQGLATAEICLREPFGLRGFQITSMILKMKNKPQLDARPGQRYSYTRRCRKLEGRRKIGMPVYIKYAPVFVIRVATASPGLG